MVKANEFLNVCQKCKATCCKMGGPDFTEKEMKKVLKAVHKNYFIKLDKNHYELKSKRGRCPYLKKDNSCEIHKVKPLICLCWPVLSKFKKDRREFLIVECPMTPLLSKKDIEKCKKEASKIPRKIVENGWKMSTIPESELKIILKRFKKFKKKKLR